MEGGGERKRARESEREKDREKERKKEGGEKSKMRHMVMQGERKLEKGGRA